MKKPKREEYVYMDCHINLSTKKMADLLYSVIMCHAEIGQSYGVGIYQYSRVQNAHNGCDFKIIIHPSLVNDFENMSGFKLTKPIIIKLNTLTEK